MSELDEFGIVRYIIDTGDKVVSILLNDIAEATGEDHDTLLMKVKKDNILIYEELWWEDTPKFEEYILAKGVKLYVNTWIIDSYIIFQVNILKTQKKQGS